ncbi:MAG: CocE/NonD family hydrolase, partial [Actinobacteria bacterium]
MRTTRWALAAVLLALIAPSAALADGWTPYDRPATNGITTEKDVPITMSDGIVLSADVYRPDQPGRYPVIITQTPYNKESALGAANMYLVERGYVHVVVDVRGTGSSQGSWDFVRAQRAARRGRGRRVVAPPAVERRRRRPVGRVVHGDHAADDRGAPPARPQGHLPDRPDGRQLPRHHVLRRADQHVVHPAVARTGHRHEPRAAGLRAGWQPAEPGPRRHHARPARDQRRQLPAQHGRQLD